MGTEYQNFICMVIIMCEEKQFTKNKLIPYSDRLDFGQLYFVWRTSKVYSRLTVCWLWIRMFRFSSNSLTLFKLVNLFEPCFPHL